MKEDIIGRGTWLDKVAHELIERVRRYGKIQETVRVESGLGASGIPHLGSFADASRAFGIKLAVQDHGIPSDYIAFSDDMDGLRKVPEGLPKWLTKYLGFPVSFIPDPFKCHKSYGTHMSSLLLDSLDITGIQYTYISAYEAYKKGLFKNEIKKILENSKKIGKIIREEIFQEKYLEELPYFPICENCGKIYTAKSLEWYKKQEKLRYHCIGTEIRGNRIEGCGFKGESSIDSAQGKLSWKVEFAARWKALKINFEAYGKDIADSVRVNDRIIEEIFDRPAPYHVRYEMFLDKGGRKISKSSGNVFTPQVWLRYGSRRSLFLLMFKRIVGTRELSVLDIPKYMDEIDYLEDIYFDLKKLEDDKEKAKLKGLYEYCNLLKIPKKPTIHIPYNLMIELARLAPNGDKEKFLKDKLKSYNYPVEKYTEEMVEKIRYSLKWVEDFEETSEEKDLQLKQRDRKAIKEIAENLRDTENESEIQDLIFSTARDNNIPPKDFFKTLYKVLIGKPYGPKLGSYIISLGKEKTIDLIMKNLDRSEIE